MKNISSKKKQVQVAVVDGDPLRFVGLRTLLACDSELELVSVPLAEIPTRRDIDVLLLWNHSAKNAFDAMAWLNARSVSAPIVLTGNRMTDEALLEALRRGARGCIGEGAAPEEFARALRVVAEGSVWAPRRILSMFVEQTQGTAQRGQPPCSRPFTTREKEVLQMLVAGCSNKEIGAPLGIEERTVKAHVAKLMRKVGVQNRIALSIHAITHSLVSPR